MFKKRLQQFLSKFLKEEPPLPAPEPVQDLQTRLQHLSERYPSNEPSPDAVAVQMHEVELCEVDFATEQELALGTETKGLNNWASKRRKTTASSDSIPLAKTPFEFAIDPGRAPSKTPDDNRLSQLNAHKRNSFDEHDSRRDIEPIRTNELRRDMELLKDSGSPFDHALFNGKNRDDKLRDKPVTEDELLKDELPKTGLSKDGLSNGLVKDKLQTWREPQPLRPIAGQQISDAALREIARLEQTNRTYISRSLSGLHDDDQRETALADKWDCCSYNSLFVLPDQCGATTEYEVDFEEDLLPYFTETLRLQEEELVDPFELPGPAAPAHGGQSGSHSGGQSGSHSGGQPGSHSSAHSSPASHSGSGAGAQKTGNASQSKDAASKSNITPTSKESFEKASASANTGATESSTALQPYKNFSENALKLIAQKPETPAPALKWLASHSNPHIRAAVAKNPSTPSDTITVLAKDHEAGIRHSIAENPLSSMDALNLLVKDRNPLIAWRAQNTVFQIKEGQRTAQRAKEAALVEAQKEKESIHQVKEAKIATTEETIAFLQVIARKTNTPARRLEELAKHADPRVRGAVAENANAPAEILWILSKDPESLVKTKVTDNYNCPIEILEAMKEDEDAYVAYQAHSVLNRVLGASFTDNHIRTATWP
ncbi:MAG TPA: hypothetical protein V6C89_21995 [Drouetiella sp.]